MTNEPNLNGPESIPLREYVKTFPLIVSIYTKDDKCLRSERIDYGNPEHRRWLGRVTFWACKEGYSVETVAAEHA